MILLSLSWAYIWRMQVCIYNRHTCTYMFLATLFTIAKLRIQPTCPSTDECINNIWYITTMEFFSHKEEWNCVICRKMDGIRNHHLKWHKLDWERDMSHFFLMRRVRTSILYSGRGRGRYFGRGIIKRGESERSGQSGGEFSQSTLYACMETLQWYSYNIC
jgi:hypothetical protein